MPSRSYASNLGGAGGIGSLISASASVNASTRDWTASEEAYNHQAQACRNLERITEIKAETKQPVTFNQNLLLLEDV